MLSSLTDKSIVLGVCGGIAAYKSVDLLRLITKCGASARVILTEHAAHFVGSMTFEALSGQPVCQSLFEKGGNTSIKHIEWAQTARCRRHRAQPPTSSGNWPAALQMML